MFHATPALLGKAIRCRDCRKIFRVPAEPAKDDVGAEAGNPDVDILVAIECVVNGVDARRCPACGHTFSMQPRLAGKRIRCRGCKAMFGVLASVQRDVPAQKPAAQAPPSEPEPEVVEEPAPVIHDDGGDVLLAEPVGEDVLVAVRPRVSWRSRKPLEQVRGAFTIGPFR